MAEAFQYWQHKGLPEKQQFINLGDSYHGDTVGAVSVGNIDVFHKVYKPLLFNTKKMTCPSFYHSSIEGINSEIEFRDFLLQELEDYLKENSDKVAAMIIEPLVQAAAGMLMQPKGYIKGVRELTEKYNVLLIIDEVATGFGRTGKLFACENEGICPDMMCLSKGITAGYMALGATMVTDIKLFTTDIHIPVILWLVQLVLPGWSFLKKTMLLKICRPKWRLLQNIYRR